MIYTKNRDIASHENVIQNDGGNVYLTINSDNNQFQSNMLQIEGEPLLFLRTRVIKHPLGNIKKLSGKNVMVKSFVVNSNVANQHLKMSYSFFNEENELIDTVCLEEDMENKEHVFSLSVNYHF
jgi:hypothetical protein